MPFGKQACLGTIPMRTMTKKSCFYAFILMFISCLAAHGRSTPSGPEWSPCGNVIFRIGRPDGRTSEFRHWIKWEDHVATKDKPVHRFVVGKHRDREWLTMHASTRDLKNAGHSFITEIEFESDCDYDRPLYFIIGSAFYHATEPSLIHIDINDCKAEPVRAPSGGIEPVHFRFNANTDQGFFRPTVIEIPKGAVVKGKNVLRTTLADGSWIFFDYLVLCDKPAPPKQLPPKDLKTAFRGGPMKDTNEILFVVRKPGSDEHWYANFGYYAADHNHFPFPIGTGSKMQILNVDTGAVRTIFEDGEGMMRDPQIDYDGKKVIFSYMPAGKRHYNLYEINIDGGGLRQITRGDWDDIEPTYTASGDIVFCSSRAKRLGPVKKQP